jgi:hypothetical protein
LQWQWSRVFILSARCSGCFKSAISLALFYNLTAQRYEAL